jgi:hypothetical protein
VTTHLECASDHEVLHPHEVETAHSGRIL